MSLTKKLHAVKSYIDNLQVDESTDVCADIKRFQEVDDVLFDLLFCEGVDKLVKICNNYVYHELDGSWVFLSSNAISFRSNTRLHKISKFL